MRILVGLLLFLAGAAAGFVVEAWWRHDGVLGFGRGLSSSPSASAPLAPASRAAIAAGVERCRDDCEQWAIVAQTGDAPLRACRAACDRTTPAPVREPIRSVTRAPADHGRTVRNE